MWMIPFLICFPFLVSIVIYPIRQIKVRKLIAYTSTGIIMAVTGILFSMLCSI